MSNTKHIYTHPTGCYSLEHLFKKKMVQAISRHVEDNHVIFLMHESYKSKYSIQKQRGGRWMLTDRDEVIRAIKLAKQRKNVVLVEEKEII